MAGSHARDIALQPLGATVALFRMRRSEARSAFSASELERLDELEERFHRVFPRHPRRLGRHVVSRVARGATERTINPTPARCGAVRWTW